ncbi:hypothetical protein GSI_06419 [Ganoderma sinense ZZ0214-1]|uniref:Uncharacterized protein n=1 Tax=Ganoderma sinense ZZ0214-1 TaxID=1077348 RepID=A0A2G8SD65_9APHY|nr:hypothetical protein GSI_06419 [Ganoderma sinense ZZ0214-1]
MRGFMGVSPMIVSLRSAGWSSPSESSGLRRGAACPVKESAAWDATRARFSLTGEGETCSPRRRLRARVTGESTAEDSGRCWAKRRGSMGGNGSGEEERRGAGGLFFGLDGVANGSEGD